MPTKHALPEILAGAELVMSDEPFDGIVRATYRSAKATVTAYVFEPGAAFPLHAHAEEQITVILDGDVDFAVADSVRHVTAGQTLVAPSGVTHGITAGPNGARFVAIVVPPRSRPDAYVITES